MDFDPNAVGVYNLGVYVYSLKALCWPLLRSAWRPSSMRMHRSAVNYQGAHVDNGTCDVPDELHLR